MISEAYVAFLRGKIVAICEALLKEEIGVIAASRILTGLEHKLLHREDGPFKNDEDFLTFVAIDSETDHLPVDFERVNWSLEALQRKDKEIAQAEAFYKETAFEAGRQLIARFDVKETPD